jgi:PTH1 family peptidyl-tRNA hydrolase
MAVNLHNRIHLIAGLGNPGDKYAGTRHNAGFMTVDRLLDKLSGTFEEHKLHNAVYHQGKCRGARLIVAKPLTFMNASGEAVELIARKNNIYPEETLIIYDDMDLPLGTIRIRDGGGGTGGHNGVASVINEFGSANFARLRIGIGRTEKGNQVDHVLAEFGEGEKKEFENTLDRAVEAAKFILYRGTKEAMNKFNAKK